MAQRGAAMMTEVLGHLVTGAPLDEEAARRAFELVLRGDALPEQVAAMLAMVQMRGVGVDELVGGARAMRAHATRVEAGEDPARPLIDTCGTGGARKTFNVSTAAAIVAAATGLARVCKHGNRSRTGRGSAEVLAELGVNIDASPRTQARCLNEVGVCFSFAVRHHPAMVHAKGPRAALGFATIFNLLGPLTNPAGAERQLLGVYDAALAGKVAAALRRLGCARALVLHSEDGLDEASIAAATRVWDVGPRGVKEGRMTTRHAGVEAGVLDDVRARSVGEAAIMVREALGGWAGPARSMIELNAGAALVAAGVAKDVREGASLAREAIDSGAAMETLGGLARVSQLA